MHGIPRNKHKTRSSRSRLPDLFIDLPGASRVAEIPDLESFDKKGREERRATSRWERSAA